MHVLKLCVMKCIATDQSHEVVTRYFYQKIMTSTNHYQLIYKILSSSSHTHLTNQSYLIVHYFHYHNTISPSKDLHLHVIFYTLKGLLSHYYLRTKMRNFVTTKENYSSILMCTSLISSKQLLKILICKHVTIQMLFYYSVEKAHFLAEHFFYNNLIKGKISKLYTRGTEFINNIMPDITLVHYNIPFASKASKHSQCLE